MATKYYGVPFGNTGDKTTIPDPLQPSGDVSYELGWTPLYELNPATDPSAKRIERAKHNQIFNDLTTNIKQLQDFGVPEYFNLTAKPAGYSKNSRVLFTDGEVYISLVNSNTDTPPSANWKQETAEEGTLVHDMGSDADYTLVGAENRNIRYVITDTGVLLTATRNINIDTIQRRFLAVNSTLQTLTFKTVAGVGITVLKGQTVDLYCDGVNVIYAIIPPLGVNQTRQNLTGIAALNVTYNNTTGRPIEISLTRLVHAGATSYTCTFLIDGVTVSTNSTGGVPEVDIRQTITFTIKAGETYRAEGGAPVLHWFELR